MNLCKTSGHKRPYCGINIASSFWNRNYVELWNWAKAYHWTSMAASILLIKTGHSASDIFLVTHILYSENQWTVKHNFLSSDHAFQKTTCVSSLILPCFANKDSWLLLLCGTEFGLLPNSAPWITILRPQIDAFVWNHNREIVTQLWKTEV